MSRRILILLPSAVPTGPVKGGIALANLLSEKFIVELIFIAPGDFFTQGVLESVRISFLSRRDRRYFSAFCRFLCYVTKNKLKSKDPFVSLSLCLQADLFNVFASPFITTISSVRGNLFKNYSHTYPTFGSFLAFIHLSLLRFLSHVFVMSHEMYLQVQPFLSRSPLIINNFIDEPFIEPYRLASIDPSSTPSLIFVGSLVTRKEPDQLLKAFIALGSSDIILHFLGDGPLINHLRQLALDHGVFDRVVFHGHLNNPYPLISSADLFVLPSLSEGISRASLEALYLGVPCILRNVDANSSIIQSPEQGALFNHPSELPNLITSVLHYSRSRNTRKSLLGPQHTRHHALTLLTNYLSEP